MQNTYESDFSESASYLLQVAILKIEKSKKKTAFGTMRKHFSRLSK